MSSMDEEEGEEKLPLPRLSVFYYGVGHMLNDITSACWFTYLLVFLTDIGLSPSDAAVVMLSGQIADGFTTIFAGELLETRILSSVPLYRILFLTFWFGHFKIWHGAGSLLVALSFSSVFGGCLPCKIVGSNSSTLKTVVYGSFAAIFNVGWAATQVSHMSMVNCITLNSTSRVVLASCRNSFSMVANLGLYAVAFSVFKFSTSKTSLNVEQQYRWIAYVSIAIGCFFVAIFYLGTKEPRLKQEAQGRGYDRISWSYWFKKVLFYQVALVYMLTRLVTNVSQAFLALYVVDDLQMSQSSKALVPAVIYISSFIVSILLQEIAWDGKRLKAVYCIGGLLWIFCGAGILSLPKSMNYFMYIFSLVIGIANALVMVTGVSMQSFLVGEDVNGCAFVCGSLSFLDKISCGLALYFIESYQTVTPELYVKGQAYFHFSSNRIGMGFVPAICALVAVAITCSMKLQSPTLKPLTQPLLA